MTGSVCPQCGGRELRCREYVRPPLGSAVPAWFWGRGAAFALSVILVCAAGINLSLLWGGSRAGLSVLAQLLLALVLLGLVWLGTWRAEHVWPRSLWCRCVACKARWERQVRDAGSAARRAVQPGEETWHP